MLALLIEDVTLLKADRIAVHVRFRGGETCSLTVEAPKTWAKICQFKPELIEQLDQLLETCTPQQAADRLNALGYLNWENEPFTKRKVISIRFAYKLKTPFQRLRGRGFVFAEELARRLQVSTSTIHAWDRAGLLSRHYYGDRRFLLEPVSSATIRREKDGRLIPSFTRTPQSR
jgi:hypothetical protein